jgi:hypothetical protein
MMIFNGNFPFLSLKNVPLVPPAEPPKLQLVDYAKNWHG